MLSEWSEFFVASAGAGAALAGLIIVAVSGDVDRVIKIPGMASRAGVAIALLVMVTLVSLGALIPTLSAAGFGALALAVGLGTTVLAVLSLRSLMAARAGGSSGEAAVKGSVGMAPALCVTLGGVLVLLGAQAGLLWIAAGILLAVVASVLASWVILIEIRR